jgi:DNA end-binding protein Ku
VPERRGFWSGTVTFGLVSIPVSLMPATRSGGAHFRMLAPDGTPLARRWRCSKEDVPIADEDIARGWEVRDGRFVLVTDEELEALEPEKSRDIELREFVSCDDVDPLYFERPYYLVPTGASSKAYALLAHVMEQTARAGIATFVMRERAYVVALLASNGILRAETLRFADEIRTAEAVGLPAPKKAEPARVAALQRAMKRLHAKTLDEKLLADEFAAAVDAAARKKLDQGRDVVEAKAAPEEEEGTTVDLMTALRKALGSREAGRRVSPARRDGSGRRVDERRKRKRGSA